MQNCFHGIQCIAFDLDGTVYIGNELVEGFIELFNKIKASGRKVYFVTNNSSLTREQVYLKLIRLGVETEVDLVINSAYAVSQYLHDNKINDVYAFGATGFLQQLTECGVNTNSANAPVIVIGYDPTYNLDTLSKMINSYQEGKKIIVANMERSFLVANSTLAPGVGAIVKAFEYVIGAAVDVVVGKPSGYMLQLMNKDNNYQPESILVIGDSYEMDIAMAKDFGANAVLLSRKSNELYRDCIVIKDYTELMQMIG